MKTFFNNKELIYIVYPAGTAGDLLSLYISIQKNAKYTFTGISRFGRINYLDSVNFIFKTLAKNKKTDIKNLDYKKSLINVNILDNLFLNKEKVLVFNSHLFYDDDLKKFLLDFEPDNKKIIRIRCRNNNDEFIRQTMLKEKLSVYEKQKFPGKELHHESLLEIYFEDILIDTNNILDQINDFLNVDIELANRGIFDLWKSKQPDSVKQAIKEIYGVDYG